MRARVSNYICRACEVVHWGPVLMPEVDTIRAAVTPSGELSIGNQNPKRLRLLYEYRVVRASVGANAHKIAVRCAFRPLDEVVSHRIPIGKRVEHVLPIRATEYESTAVGGLVVDEGALR